MMSPEQISQLAFLLYPHITKTALDDGGVPDARDRSASKPETLARAAWRSLVRRTSHRMGEYSALDACDLEPAHCPEDEDAL